ncbi:MAG: aldo/keto reductase [Gulosibacter sp.]|uniref:aldo/keto reductase n=1 Tax=Gulosibacter sp. TaxID=2817531 RepID=UPI003F8FC88C
MTRIPRTELDIFPLNLGGNTFGWTSDRDASFAVLDAFVEAGGNFIDTADSYAQWQEGSDGGDSERILGEWLQARGNRKDVIIATKVGGLTSRQGLSRENADLALNESLERLQTDYVDIYYAHYDDESVSIDEQVQIAHDLVQSGRVHHIALSNFTPERMREWFETATEKGLTVPVAIQPQYNLVSRADYEQGYAPIARDFDAAVFPFFALASGFLTGKYRKAEDLEGAARQGMASGYATDEGFNVVDALVEVAEARGDEPTTVALAWLLAKGVTAPIASASKTEQLPAIMAAPALELTAEEITKLDEASASFA